MCHVNNKKNEKRERAEGMKNNQMPNQERTRDLGEKEKLQLMKILKANTNQCEHESSSEEQKTSRTQDLQ